MRKVMIAIVLAVVLVAGGLGGFAYAQNNPRQPMTGEKLVGYGFYGEHYIEEIGRTVQLHTMFVFTNPDCVNEITIDGVFILNWDGAVLYEGYLLGFTEPVIIKPHEVNSVELHDYIDPQELLMPVTVEIFWAGSQKSGLPLTGWAQTGHLMFDGEENLVEGSVDENQMVNMEQKLKPKD